MSNADRIEELRDKYEENPRRYFAPLANEYRKAGDLAQAIAICREHLPKQPGHMSGYIVFGQTLFEANSLDEARSVFEQALTLDPENLIALKHLGDIARMNGENSVARRWYARVLDADPRNDDIASQLSSLGAPTPVVPMSTVPAPAPNPEPPIEEAVGVFATFDPASLPAVPEAVDGVAADNEFWSPVEAPPAAVHEPLDLDFPEDPEPEATADFEEGLRAPVWPDTSELVARLVTPLRSATPISVPATPEAVEAFGREPSDAAEPAPLDVAPQDQFVDAFLSADAAHSQVTPPEVEELDEIDQHAGLFDDAGIDHDVRSVDAEASGSEVLAFEIEPVAADALHTVRAFSEPLSVAVDEPITLIEFASLEENESVSVENSAASADAQLFEPLIDTPSETSANVREWAEPESVPLGEIEDFAFAVDLPWESEGPPEHEIPTEFEAVAEDIAVTAEFPVPTPPASRELEESFAEISSALQDEREASDRDAAEFEAEAGADVASAGVVSVEVASNEHEPAQPFVTETMAELLVSQGFHARAIEVYGELVRRRPHDPVLLARLAELREFEAADLAHAELVAETPAQRFNTPLRNTPVYNTPQYAAPQYATPLSATPVLVSSLGGSASTGSNLSERNAADRLQAFRTARERFSELARRRVARRTPSHATAIADDPSEGLSSLFGTALPATTDELAARALADAFGPVQDSGESLFDPAPATTPAMPMRSLTPRATSSIQSRPAVESRSDRQPSADYSFDKFFPDPAMAAREAQSSPTTATPASSPAQPVNEDLAQFSAWLKGLNNA